MPNNTNQMDRRNFPRITTNFSLEVSPSEVGHGEGKDVSQGGLQFNHKGKVNPGQILNLTIRVNGFSGDVSIKGKVVRCDPSGSDGYYNVAVNFVDIDAETEKSVIDMINSF
jgi:hypothetical protein